MISRFFSFFSFASRSDRGAIAERRRGGRVGRLASFEQRILWSAIAAMNGALKLVETSVGS